MHEFDEESFKAITHFTSRAVRDLVIGCDGLGYFSITRASTHIINVAVKKPRQDQGSLFLYID